MSYGFHGKIAIIDLTNEEISIDKKDQKFYRKYLGGPGISTYYALKEIPAKIDPLSSENALIVSSSVLTGSPGPAVMRYTVSAKSPLTNTIGKSEAGGWWGPEFSKTGFDALVIKGKAEKPIYIYIEDGKIKIEDAKDIWGKVTKESEIYLQEKHGSNTRVMQIGPAGENQVLYANICNDLAHFNGRNGMGAVMGSKNLKAIAVNGNNRPDYADKEKAKEILKWVSENVMKHPLTSLLHKTGTAGGITSVNTSGALPTNNWQKNYFEDADKIGSEALENILIKRGGCYGCPIRCKRVVGVDCDEYTVDPDYGGPEYETLGAIGSNCGINDIDLIAKANELCNKYTLDTISFGMTLSFAMNCYENGLLTIEDTGGLELSFGNKEILLPLIKQTAFKEGFGDRLALGSAKLSDLIGDESKELLRTVKNQELPMHDPRVKTGLGFQFALSNHGADHWAAQHDPFFVDEESMGMDLLRSLGIQNPIASVDLGANKVRFFYYTNLLTLLYDCLGTCVFGVVARGILPTDKYLELINAVTGWNTNYWELMKVGERTSNLMRLFNVREGFNKEDDTLPDHFYKKINGGPLDGEDGIDESEFDNALELYYQMAGWNQNGIPQKGKVYELGIMEDLEDYLSDLKWI